MKRTCPCRSTDATTLTPLTPGTGGWQEFTANQGAPTPGVTTDPHVFSIEDSSDVHRFWYVKGQFSATAGDSECIVKLHSFVPSAWVDTHRFKMKIVSSDTIGDLHVLYANADATHCAFEVSGLGDGDEIKLQLTGGN